MLRWILGARRRKLAVERDESDDEPEPKDVNDEGHMTHEPWLEWIVRTTRLVEDHLNRVGLEDRVTAIRRKK